MESLSEVFIFNTKRLMTRLEYTTSSLSAASNMPQKTIWSALNEPGNPTLKTVERLSVALKADASVLLLDKQTEEQLVRSLKVGATVRALIQLPDRELTTVSQMVQGLLKE